MKRVAFILILMCVAAAWAQTPWKQPPADITALFDAPRTPAVCAYPETGQLLFWRSPGYVPLSMLAWPTLRLAGLDITPLNNGERRSGYLTDPWLLDVATGDSLRLNLPPDAVCGHEVAAPDGRSFVFNLYERDNISLWRCELPSGRLRRLVASGVNQVMGDSFLWMPDSRHVLVQLTDEHRGEPPAPPLTPVGPVTYETRGEKSQLRTYPNLLQNDYDEALFRYYATTQFALVDARDGSCRLLGKPGLYTMCEPSPDGRYLLVNVLSDSLSRRIPAWGFASRYELWDDRGRVLETLAVLPSRIGVPEGGVLPGPRSLHWQPWLPHTLVWAQALDGGDTAMPAPWRDRLFTRDVTSSTADTLRTLRNRYAGVDYLSADEAVFYEYDRDRKWRTATCVNAATGREQVIADVSTQDLYNQPGKLLADPRYPDRALVRGGAAFLSGPGQRPDGAYPFLDRLPLDSLVTQRLWQSRQGRYERLVQQWNDHTLLLWSESATDPPNLLLRDLATGSERALTRFTDAAAVLSTLPKRLVQYRRADGLVLSGMLYLPPDWDGHTRLPLLMTAYPEEYVDPENAGQARNSANRYTRVWGASPLYLCLHGYAVLQNAGIAVVGDPETVNETFIEQVVSSAAAAIAYLDSTGVIDPARVAVQGHSYGAFMVVNLLAHSNLFAAGIAQNGAYNRTLTPFGFQSERRTLWQAQDLYLHVSPLLYADHIHAPLLLVHSQDDTNSGTYPMQSKRLYEALDGLGATCRYIELPLEDHTYVARETHLHLLAEYIEFLDEAMGE